MGYGSWQFNIPQFLLCLLAGSWGYLDVKDITGKTNGWLSLSVSAGAAAAVTLVIEYIKRRVIVTGQAESEKQCREQARE